MTMIENVARASAFARRSRHDKARDADHYWEHLGAETQATELQSATAALQAMLEPNDEMVSAGRPFVTGYDDMRSTYSAWQAMIQAALNQEEGR
jgi:hypothetical protein